MSICGFNSISSCTNSASLGCSGYESDELLQALTAQVKKLRLRTFMVNEVGRRLLVLVLNLFLVSCNLHIFFWSFVALLRST